MTGGTNGEAQGPAAALLQAGRFLRRGEASPDHHSLHRVGGRAADAFYRDRWSYDKVVRSTHGVNCTGSCSWKVYVKDGIITWEAQETDYPSVGPDRPEYEPRGCPRGAAFSWYTYSPTRVRYPYVRGALLEMFRDARRRAGGDPVRAWADIVTEPERARAYKTARGTGGLVRATWDEAVELVAAAHVHTIQTWGPDRIAGFSPIPAMSMASHAVGSRFLSLIGGVMLSFYDWYADLPVASPQVFGDQTDVPESGDWWDASYLLIWGSNPTVTRTPDAHWFAEARYRGQKVVVVSPDYSDTVKFADEWLPAQPGTDAALAMAMGHVILREFLTDRPTPRFIDYAKRFTDLPFLVTLRQRGDAWVPDRFVSSRDLGAADLGAADLGDDETEAAFKPVVLDAATGQPAVPNGSLGFRFGQTGEGRWNLDLGTIRPRLTLHTGAGGEAVPVDLPRFDLPPDTSGSQRSQGDPGRVRGDHEGGQRDLDGEEGARDQVGQGGREGAGVLRRGVPVRRLGKHLVTTVFDLVLAQYGVGRDGLPGEWPEGYDDPDQPYTPAWQEPITSVPAAAATRIAREFARNAADSGGRSMIIMGAGANHWFHADTIYRSMLSLLLFTGCQGVNGGGWAHYVGQEKIRPLTGWAQMAGALDWTRPPRQMISTAYWYLATDQWRYDHFGADALASPLGDGRFAGQSTADLIAQSARLGWMPSYPTFDRNPLDLADEAAAAGADPADHTVAELRAGRLKFACTDPDAPESFPRILTVWRANLLGSSAKGDEYFLKHLLGAEDAVRATEAPPDRRPRDVTWRDPAPEGKLDLLVAMDFRMTSTTLYADVVLPAATWYEKYDLSSTDLHPYVHAFNPAIPPPWQTRSDFDIFHAIARSFSRLAATRLGTRKDLVAAPLLHDTPDEMATPFGHVRDWQPGVPSGTGPSDGVPSDTGPPDTGPSGRTPGGGTAGHGAAQVEPVPGVTMPKLLVVERDYGAVAEKMAALGPLADRLGATTKGVTFDLTREVGELGQVNGTVTDGVAAGRPSLARDTDLCEAILALSGTTNGHLAVQSFQTLERRTGTRLADLAAEHAGQRITFADTQAAPVPVISSPEWSGSETGGRRYSAFTTNVERGKPWHTLTGRQHFYLDHEWMAELGEQLPTYRPPLDMHRLFGEPRLGEEGDLGITLRYLTPHSKWSIHSEYQDNLLMLTLSRGGPTIWLSPRDAARIKVADNDWIEAVNRNGVVVARAIVSHRMPEGTAFMYHAQERVVDVPKSETSGHRGGIHNSLTRLLVKPTHLIGGYAQLSFAFNYLGPTGNQRDEITVIRRRGQEVTY